MNKEKVRELAAKLFTECGLHIPKGESVIKEWLEQNPIEPVVVGLSDEQIEQLAHETFQFVEEFFCENEDIPVAGDYTHHLKSWLKHEDFAQPEVKEVVVGLSDEQVNAFACYYGLSTTEQSKLRCELKKWQKTQTFAQPAIGTTDSRPNWDDAPEWANWLACDKHSGWHWHKNKPFIDVSGWESDYKFIISNENWKQTLQERPSDTVILISEQKQDVKFDSWHNITPRFNMQPDEAVSCHYKLVYTDKHGEEVNVATYSNCAIERPKPTPQVEVGQVWIHKKTLNEYVIEHLGATKIGDKWVDSVTYIYDYSEYEGKEKYTRTLDDFLAKFEQVQS